MRKDNKRMYRHRLFLAVQLHQLKSKKTNFNFS